MAVEDFPEGKKFGKWTVLGERVGPNHNGKYRQVCQCECGRTKALVEQSLLEGISTQCKPCWWQENRERKSLLGDRFNDWTVVEVLDPRYDHYTLLLRCDCGSEQIYPIRKINHRKPKICLECKRRRDQQQVLDTHWSSIVRGAESRGIPVTASQAEAYQVLESQAYYCALSGVKLLFAQNPSDYQNRPELHTASLDRIDSDLGYDPGNLQWVHKRINLMKNVISQEDFIYWCKQVAATHR